MRLITGSESHLPNRLVMVDCEMTGVVPKRDHLLQAAFVKLQLNAGQYEEIGEPLVLYLKYAGSPRNAFQKKYLTHIFAKCNESDLTPSAAREALDAWLGDWKGQVPPCGDCVPVDIAFLLEKGVAVGGDIDDESHPLPGTFHYEYFDLNSLKCAARTRAGHKFDKELPGLDHEGIHDGLVDCRNQHIELNGFLRVLL